MQGTFLRHVHERRFNTNHNMPAAATTIMTMMLHDIDEPGSTLGAGEAERGFPVPDFEISGTSVYSTFDGTKPL